MGYCKKCGNQLEDDAIFCSKCGVKIAEDENKNENEKPKEETSSKGTGCLIAVFIFIVIVIVAFIILANQPPAGKKTNSSNGSSGSNKVEEVVKQLVSRRAYNSDIIIEDKLNLSSLGVDLIITPNTDITNLKIEITYYDRKNNVLQTQTVALGNVKEGVQVKKTISIIDFNPLDMLRIYSTSISVVDGTVYYFG